MSPPPVSLKRPLLISRDYEDALLEDEQQLPCLYDYSTQQAWYNHPIKRLKQADKPPPPPRKPGSLYPPVDGDELIGAALAMQMAAGLVPQPGQPAKLLEIKQEPGVASVSLVFSSVARDCLNF